MNLNYNQWFVKWFFWCCKVVDESRATPLYDSSNKLDHRYSGSTDICTMMKILFLATFLVFLNVAAWLLLIAGIIILPILAYGVVATTLGYAVIALLIATVLSILALTTWTQDKYADFKSMLNNAAENGTGFLSVILNWFKCLKERTCVLIKFDRKQNDKDVK